VDNGGFFPEESDSLYRDKAWFLMDGMVLLGTDAAGMSEKELKYGKGWLLAQLKRSRLPMTNANVWDKQTKKTLLPPYLIIKKGTVTTGVFAVTSDKVDLGPARDSLTIEDPAVAANRVIPEMKKKGATVIVLLSQLGKVESEDLVTAVDGIDVVITGRNVPVLQKGRMIKNTIACYGGEQGQNIGRTVVTLDAAKKMQTGENDVFVMGPEVGEKPEVLQLVKSFNDAFNDKMRKLEKERAVQSATQTGGEGQGQKQSVDHFVGSEVCQRCHMPEYAQWLKTDHATSWATSSRAGSRRLTTRRSWATSSARTATAWARSTRRCRRRRRRSPRPRAARATTRRRARCSTSRCTSRTSCTTRRRRCRRFRPSRRTAR